MKTITTSPIVSNSSIAILVFVTSCFCVLSEIRADIVLDLATSTNGTSPDTTLGTINGAMFLWGHTGGGTGNIHSFVQIQGKHNGHSPEGVQRGYNTTANDVLDSQNTDTFNHGLQVGSVPVVNLSGVDYFEFLLDVNEDSGNGEEFISLDALKIYTTDSDGQSIDPTVASFSNGVLRYDLDAGMNAEILLNFQLNHGSGTIDMRALIPVWGGANPSDWLILYSEFGAKGITTFNGSPANFSYSDGFEEWARRTEVAAAIPEPTSTAILCCPLSILLWQSRRRPLMKRNG